MASTLNCLYDYAQDFEFLIEKTDEWVKKSIFKEELSKFHAIEPFNFMDLNIRETDYLVSLSRILTDYGFSQTYESFKNACSLLLADFNHAEEMVDAAIEKFKISASRLYAGEPEVSFLWGTPDTSDPWALLVELLTESDDEGAARRKFYLKRIAELASMKSLASTMFYDKIDEVILNLSPLQLEMDFITNDGILPTVLAIHASRTDLY